MLESEIERRRMPTNVKPAARRLVAATEGVSTERKEKVACRNISENMVARECPTESISLHATNII